MRNRFYTPLLADPIELSGEEFHHAVRVARCTEGEEVECFDGRGRNVLARFVTIGRDRATLELLLEAPAREPRLRITLALALIHPERFELVLQKGCELGVASFLPLITERTEVRPERIAGKGERWNRILLEAAKQCGRAVIPAIEAPATLTEALGRDCSKIVFDLDEEEGQAETAEQDQVMIMIGPEGGFSPAELAAARSGGVRFRRMGPRRMRAETAAIAAVTLTASDLVRH